MKKYKITPKKDLNTVFVFKGEKCRHKQNEHVRKNSEM